MVVVAGAMEEAEGLEGDVLAPGKVSCFHFNALVGKRFISFAAAGGVGGGGGGGLSFLLEGASPDVGAGALSIIAALDIDIYREVNSIDSLWRTEQSGLCLEKSK